MPIGGFTRPTNAFTMPNRAINDHARNSYWNDVRPSFDREDFPWFPRHHGTPPQSECTGLAIAGQMIDTPRRLISVAGDLAEFTPPVEITA